MEVGMGRYLEGFPSSHSEAGEGAGPPSAWVGGGGGLSPVSRSSSSSNSSSSEGGHDVDGGRAAAPAMGGPGRDWARAGACEPLCVHRSVGMASRWPRRLRLLAASHRAKLSGFRPPCPALAAPRPRPLAGLWSFGLADVTGPTPLLPRPAEWTPGVRPRPLEQLWPRLLPESYTRPSPAFCTRPLPGIHTCGCPGSPHSPRLQNASWKRAPPTESDGHAHYCAGGGHAPLEFKNRPRP